MFIRLGVTLCLLFAVGIVVKRLKFPLVSLFLSPLLSLCFPIDFLDKV